MALTTTQQTVEFWAAKAAEFDQLITSLDGLLPPTHGGETPFTDQTRVDAEEAFEQARLAADTILGSYTRVFHLERANQPQQGNPYGQRFN